MDITKNIKQGVSLKDDANAKKFEWLRNLTVLASTLFAALVALTPRTQPSLCAGILLVLSLSLLCMAVICLIISLYEQVDSTSRTSQAYNSELQAAFDETREMNIVLASRRPIFAITRKMAYVVLCLALISLLAYSITVTFT